MNQQERLRRNAAAGTASKYANAFIDPSSTSYMDLNASNNPQADPLNMSFADVEYHRMPKTPGERAKTVYDFRGSRFDITQKFAEGFDPDRIAVAFMNSLQGVADHKVSSSLVANAGNR